MINVSNEFKQYMSACNDCTLPREFTAKANVKLADSTVLEIGEDNIVAGGLDIHDSTSASNNFQIGSAMINECDLLINNIESKFDDYDFYGAEIRPFVGLKLSETTEWLAKGVYTVDESEIASSIISLIALDNMHKFDVPFSDVVRAFPCTHLQLLQAVCSHCEVTLATNTFTNSNTSIVRRPSDEATTCREIVSYIAQCSGNFARINTSGALELKWYDIGAFESSDNYDGGIFDDSTPYATGDSADGGNFTDYNSGDNIDGGTFLDMNRYHHIYSLNQATISTDDIIITGIQVKAQGTESDYGETVLFGTTGYVIEISNPLITENTASHYANTIGVKIVGMRFRPLLVSALSDPSIEAGDVAYVSHKFNSYQALITNTTFKIGSSQSISCDAETPSRKQSVRFDASTKAIIEARKEVKKALLDYDLSVKQLNDLVMHSFGVYRTSEKLEDGSTIEYSHDKPTLAESQNIWKQTANTFTVSNDGGETWRGMDADGNMVVTVLNALGINAEWINVGTLSGIRIEATEGRIANMEINSNGLEVVEGSDYFYIKVGETITEYTNGEFDITTKYMNYNGGTEQEYTGNLKLGGNGFNLTFENSDNTYGAGINIYHGSNGEPILNLYTRGPGGLYDGIEVNGLNLVSQIDRINRIDGDVMNIKAKLGML